MLTLAERLTVDTVSDDPRPHAVYRSEDVKGLYLVGAGVQPGAELPGVLSSARILDALVPDAVPVR